MIEQLKAELAERACAGLQRKRRLLQSPQDAHLQADDQRLLSFASNDYLGLANHPDLILALQKGATEAGVGGGASHLITGHHQFHHAQQGRHRGQRGPRWSRLFAALARADR